MKNHREKPRASFKIGRTVSDLHQKPCALLPTFSSGSSSGPLSLVDFVTYLYGREGLSSKLIQL